MSLPEVLLVIRTDQEKRMEELRYHTQSRALANAAVWSKEAAQALRLFDRILGGGEKKAQQPTGRYLQAAYRQVGVPVTVHK